MSSGHGHGHGAAGALTAGARCRRPLLNRGAAAAHRIYGCYRLEILASLANTVLLFGVAAYVVYEAIQRWGSD
jgi:Co/Zn/Cd efflux system component